MEELRKIHLCATCAHKDECPIGLAVNEGTIDEYVKEDLISLSEDFHLTDSFRPYVIILECEHYEKEKEK